MKVEGIRAGSVVPQKKPRLMMCRVMLFYISLSCALLAAGADKPTWARKATPIGECFAGKTSGHVIPAPDPNVVVELGCHPSEKNDDPTPYLHVRTASGRWHDIEVGEGAHEVLWSPDSKAFLVNGGTSAYAGFFTTVYLLANDVVHKLQVTAAAQTDMVTTFPPCKALNRNEGACAATARDPEFNMSGLAWVRGSSAIVVIAEVPCSSSYGGIMCQVRGYELNVPDGRIAMHDRAAVERSVAAEYGLGYADSRSTRIWSGAKLQIMRLAAGELITPLRRTAR